MTGQANPLLQVRGLVKHFPTGGSWIGSHGRQAVKAVDGVDLDVGAGATLGIVGESGCGKSTLGRLLLRLIEPTAGQVRFDGEDILAMNASALRRVRRRMQMVFQDPFSSLNPRMTVGSALAEPLSLHRVVPAGQRRDRVAELLDMVGLAPDHAGRFPHEFSGGQRQRIGIARALAVEPRLIIGDEPVSALDVSIQAQIINLLKGLQRQLDLTLIVIAHDLAVVKHISDRVAVMYLGQVVELADTADLFHAPRHPYTRALLSAIPLPDPGRRSQAEHLQGDVPSPSNPPAGCRFHTRCPFAVERCSVEAPPLETDSYGHAVACHLWRDLPAAGAATVSEPSGSDNFHKRAAILDARRKQPAPA